LVIADLFRGYANTDVKFCKEAINYMNVIDVSHKEAENIFEVAERLDKAPRKK